MAADIISSNKRYFDIIVVIPLEEEVDAFVHVFEMQEDLSTQSTFRFSAGAGTADAAILVVLQEEMGKTAARDVLTQALREFDAGLVVSLGIGGSLSSDLRLGDVCSSSKIFDVLENGKASDLPEGKLSLDFSPTHYPGDRVLTAAIGFIRQKKDLRAKYDIWLKEREKEAMSLLPEPVLGREGNAELIRAPRTKEGPIACGYVTKSEKYNAKLKDIDRKVLVVDTESGGVHEVAKAHNISSLTIRGVSDHADLGKNKLEATTGGHVRRLAALNAASFLKLQLSNPEFMKFLQQRKSAKGGALGNSTNVRSLSDVVQDASAAIDGKLRELCPDFKLQPKGYRLPVPRVRQISLSNDVSEIPKRSPIELTDALEHRNPIILRIERTYPDYSLPWVMADVLLSSEIAGKRAIPIVVDGALIGPPKGNLKSLGSISLDGVDQADAMQPVYIIDGLPASSKTKLNFLRQDAEQHPDAKFVYVVRDDAHLVEITQFAVQQNAMTYELCPISFYEIAHFVQKNFSMSGSEAEVVALRLRETFQRFELSAHPTYFAGIPKEVLSALLQANRRSELIQLAVDGYLTFIVADDKADVNLSRTTRSRFLRQLAMEINLEKTSFTQAQLVEFTTEFAQRFDFAIDPMRFIQSFVDKGILHFAQDGKVKFSLPFIESYLVASELARLPAIATRYFDFRSKDFDFPAFDLYSEIGAADELVVLFRSYLDDQISLISVEHDQQHALLNEKLNPAVLTDPSRFSGLRQRLDKAYADVRSGKGDTAAKQRIIDAAERVRESASKKASIEEAGEKDSTAGVSVTKELDDAVQAWAIGVVLLGSGAEHLVAEVKQGLARQLVRLGSGIVHSWTNKRLEIDYKKLRNDLQNEEFLKSFPGYDGTETVLAELRLLVGMFVDVMEFSLIAEPFRRIADHLCENARHRVLATSVEKVEVDHPMEQILHSAWLTDIESRRGKNALHSAIRNLPAAHFLRINLATHFLTRVHWNHWRTEDRLILLDAAEEAIKPIAIKFDKGELRRAIEKSAYEKEKREVQES